MDNWSDYNSERSESNSPTKKSKNSKLKPPQPIDVIFFYLSKGILYLHNYPKYN